MLSPNQVPTEIEQIADSSMSTQKSLGLPHRFKLTHPPFPHPSRFMRLLCSIICVPITDMNCFGISSR